MKYEKFSKNRKTQLKRRFHGLSAFRVMLIGLVLVSSVGFSQAMESKEQKREGGWLGMDRGVLGIITAQTENSIKIKSGELSVLAPPRTKPALLYMIETPGNVSGVDLWLVNDDGTGRILLAGGNDHELLVQVMGDRVVYALFTHDQFQKFRGLYSVKLDGSGRLLLFDDDVAFWNFMFHKDYIVFSRDDGQAWSCTATGLQTPLGVYGTVRGFCGDWVITEPIVNGQSDLYSARLDGSQTMLLVSSSNDETYGNVIGNRVIFSNFPGVGLNSRLYSIYVDGQDRPIPLSREGKDGFDPCTAVDRVFFSEGNDSSETNYHLCSVNGDGSGFKQLTKTLGNYRFIGVMTGYPDRLIYENHTGFPNHLRSLHSVQLSGSGYIQLAGTSAGLIESLTKIMGQRVIYSLANSSDKNLFDFWSVAASGGNKTNLARGLIVFTDFFLDIPSGRCAVNYLNNGQNDIYSILPTGSSRRTVSKNPGNEFFVTGSGGRMVFARQMDSGEYDLFSVDMYGNQEKMVVDITLEDDATMAAVIMTSGKVIML